MQNNTQNFIINALDNYKAQDIVCLDVRKQTALTDAMIVCTGTSQRHVQSLADNLVHDAKVARIDIIGVEGRQSGEWVLIDLNDAVVHIMLAQPRAFYNLEKLWAPAFNMAEMH